MGATNSTGTVSVTSNQKIKVRNDIKEFWEKTNLCPFSNENMNSLDLCLKVMSLNQNEKSLYEVCKDKAVSTVLKLDFDTIMDGVKKIIPFVGDMIEMASSALPWAPIILKVLMCILKREDNLQKSLTDSLKKFLWDYDKYKVCQTFNNHLKGIQREI